MNNTIMAILIWLPFSISAEAASFDCVKAASEVEKLICSDQELSKLDEQMSKAYSAALKTVAG